MVTQPRIGQEWADCPYCGQLSYFHGYPLYSDVTQDRPLTFIECDGHILHCSGQTCKNCEGQLVFVGEDMVSPYHTLPNGRFIYLDDDLRHEAFTGYQIITYSPALAAAALRRVMEELCQRNGLATSGFPTYVDFLEDRLSDNAIKGSLRMTCLRNDKTIILHDQICWDDTDVCVIALAEILEVSGHELKAATLPISLPTPSKRHSASRAKN